MDQIARILVDKTLGFSRGSSTANRVVAIASSSADQDSSTAEASGHATTLNAIKDVACQFRACVTFIPLHTMF